MSTPSSPFQDHAAPILQGEPTITDQQRSDLWDAFHSKSPDELVQHLAPLAIPDETKHKLFQAKQASMPVAPPVDKVTEAVQRVAALDPKVLDIAESHPNILKAFTTAATIEPKPAQEPTAASSAASKGKKTAEAPEATTVPPDVPATPSGHALIHASNGGHYHVPVANLDKARAVDPNLTVLHVEP
jgi:hypothetical protein